MAHVKFTKSVRQSILSELDTFLNASIFSTRIQNVRVLCEKVGISHTTFYRQRRKSRSLEMSTHALSQEERDLISFWQRVEVLLAQLRLNCQTCNLTQMLNAIESDYAEEAQEEKEWRKYEKKERQKYENEQTRKRQQKIESTEQRTEQLTGGIGAFAFRFEKSLKNM